MDFSIPKGGKQLLSSRTRHPSNSLRDPQFKFGVMQGRFPSPVDRQNHSELEDWEVELLSADYMKVSHMEWVVKRGELWTDPLVSDPHVVKAILEGSRVRVPSVCFDFLIGLGAPGVDMAIHANQVHAAVSSCLEINPALIVFPLIETQDILGRTSFVFWQRLISQLLETFPTLRGRLSIEANIEAKGFDEFLSAFPPDSVGFTLDTGNLVSAGIGPAQALGDFAERVWSVHLKDKNERGSSVEFGKGVVEFGRILEVMRDTRRRPLITLECPRDATVGSLEYLRNLLEGESE